MEKEEVMRLAKKSKIDERETQINCRGYHYAATAMLAGLLIIMLLRWFKEDLFSQDLLFIVMLQVSTLGLYQFIKTKSKVSLLIFTIGLIAILMSLINVLTHYGYFQ